MSEFSDLTYDQFAARASEFFKTPGAFNEIENGIKALGIIWLNRCVWTDNQVLQSMVILDLASKRLLICSDSGGDRCHERR